MAPQLRESTMTKFDRAMHLATVCVALLVLTPPAMAQSRELVATAPEAASKKTHSLVLQVNSNEPATMTLALNNATNVEQYYKERGEKVEIEIVTFGPGLHMLRDDTSPVKERIKAIADKSPAISFKACGNTRENMGKAESKAIPLVAQATLVKSGVVRLMELQEQGLTYVRP
jgi:intracellular sulfur oxidation DsrE/DsrF family protein